MESSHLVFGATPCAFPTMDVWIEVNIYPSNRKVGWHAEPMFEPA